jgi:3-hydroxyisobutyrate dehydrogenase
MAMNLAKSFDTLVWNRTSSRAEEHAAAHGTTAVTELDELAQVDVLCTCLPTDVEVLALAEEIGPKLAAGTVWLDHTSGAASGSREIAELLEGHGVTYLDAPVSGGTAGAEAGKLTIMVGGDEDKLDAVTDVLDAVAAHVIHVGRVGTGMAVKAVNNALMATSLWAASEGLAALKSLGVPSPIALKVINGSSGRSFATERLIADQVVTRKFTPTFAVELMVKDVGLATTVLADAGVEGRVIPLVHDISRDAVQQLGTGVSHTSVAKVVEQASGVEIS